MSEDWSHISSWASYFDEAHERAHLHWLDRHRTGPGRMVVEGKNLRDAEIDMVLDASSFVDCDISNAVASGVGFEEAQLIRCQFVDCELVRGRFRGANIDGCSFSRSDLRLAAFESAHIQHSRFDNSQLEGLKIREAILENVGFPSVSAVDSKWDGCQVTRCIFRNADLSRSDDGRRLDLNAGTAINAHFKNCDFRNANLDGLRLKGTTFENCAFHGVQGTPDIRENVRFINCDLSNAYDGSQIVTQEELIRPWT